MAKQWDKIFKWYGGIFMELQEDMPKILKLFKKKSVRRVLDLGCGSGRHTVYLAKHGFEVYGIDIAPKGIKMTKDWLGKDRLKAKLTIGDIYKKLPYEDNFFDAIISTQTLHHNRIEEIRKLIREIERILKPKGLLFTTDRRRRLKRSVKIITEYYLAHKTNLKYKVIAPRTYVPLRGGEKGLIHYLFNKKSLKKEFKNFKIYNIWASSDKRHYSFLGELKSK